MATLWSAFLCSITVLTSYTKCVAAFGTCDDGYHIEKNTISTSNSHRDYYYSYAIFPYLEDQPASHFKDGMCALQMKVQLPDSCFKIHAPTTWQHDPGLLNVDILERKNSKKWRHVVSDKSTTYNYDAFLDFNFAFWVESLDDYFEKWQSFNAEPRDDIYNDPLVEYIGIEWQYNIENVDLQISSSDYKQNQWYSLLIHSPQSNINYEFMSYKKPSAAYYDSVKWIKTSLPRASFIAQSNPYPWQREDESPIVPVRLSRAVTNLDTTLDFYVDVIESEILYNPTPTQNDYIIDDLNGDQIATRMAILNMPDTMIELQFIQRPLYYTAGEFNLLQLEQLLRESHDQVISSPFCGIDRWMDNHMGYTTWTVDGYLDRVLTKLNTRNEQKYRIYLSSYEHSSPDGKSNLDKYGKSAVYIFFVFEPSGQALQLMGDFPNTDFGALFGLPSAPLWDAQWCHRDCPYGMLDGVINPSHVYIDTEDYLLDDYNDRNRKQFNLFSIGTAGQEHHEKYLLATLTSMTCGMIMCGLYYAFKKWKKKRLIQNLVENSSGNSDQTPLITKP